MHKLVVNTTSLITITIYFQNKSNSERIKKELEIKLLNCNRILQIFDTINNI